MRGGTILFRRAGKSYVFFSFGLTKKRRTKRTAAGGLMHTIFNELIPSRL